MEGIHDKEAKSKGNVDIKDEESSDSNLHKHTESTDALEVADLNANISTGENIDGKLVVPQENIKNSYVLVADEGGVSVSSSSMCTDEDNSCEQENVMEVKEESIVEVNEEYKIVKVEELELADNDTLINYDDTENKKHDNAIENNSGFGESNDTISEEIRNTENVASCSKMVYVDENEGHVYIQEQEPDQEGYEEVIEQDGTSTVVVATDEGGQYEIHMVSDELGESHYIAGEIPEGTQLMTEDGQLLHAVQEDECGNVVVVGSSENVTYEQVENTVEQQSEEVMVFGQDGYIVTEGESEEFIVGEAPTLEVTAEAEVGTSVEDNQLAEVEDNPLDKYVPEQGGQVVVERIGYQVPMTAYSLSQPTEHEVVHEEFVEEEEEIPHEPLQIPERNHTIPNYDEASEIQRLTEAANNSLKHLEMRKFNKKKRPRKKKVHTESETENSETKPKKKKVPTATLR